MAKHILNLIQADNGAILKVTDGFPEDNPYIIIKEGNPSVSGDDCPFSFLVGKYFSNFIIEEEWGDGDDVMQEFEVTVDIKRIK